MRIQITLLLGCAIAAGACVAEGAATSRAALVAQCTPRSAIPDQAWVCPTARVMTCDELRDATIYVPQGDALLCEEHAIHLAYAGPFEPGDHVVTVESDNGETCNAGLTVIDQTAPRLQPHTITLWPPNHKLHEIDVADCVSAIDDCDGELRGEVIWVSSDEPTDDLGDGSSEPDVVPNADCSGVALRSERQGGADGRVYTVGVRVIDAEGNQSDASCQVVVPHDQSGNAAIDSGEAYRVSFDGSNGTPLCGEP